MATKILKSEKIRRRMLAKFRFRALVRKVIINNAWLNELEDTKLGDNVRRNVAIIVRGKSRKGILTIHEKRMLNTPLERRTMEQKKKLVRIMTKLNCFSRYPPVVRAKLSYATYYVYYNIGRTIIRENNEPSALYFIISGEILVLQRHFIPSEQCYKDIPIAVKGPGDLFGEVALLLNIKRTATCVTSKDTELLCVYKHDFDKILRETLLSQWDEIIKALTRFELFANWTIGQKRECCVLSSIKQYDPQSIIISEDNGLLTPVHFVLSGKCQIMQCLKMFKKTVRGKNFYTLVDVDVVKRRSQEVLDKFNRAATQIKFNEHLRQRSIVRKRTLSSQEINEEKPTKPLEKTEPITYSKTEHEDQNNDPQIHQVFIDAGTYSCGSVFGLGEQMEHRTIVARNVVQCLVMPRYWLLRRTQNVGNVWARTKIYLDTVIPTRQKLFEDYLATKKWKNYRESVVNDVIKKNTTTQIHSTTIYDIPRVCRIEESRL